jgi:hypothetical protein
MNTSSLSLDHRLNELSQVAADLRAERTLAAPAKGGPGRLRVVVGQALLAVGSALVAPSSRRSATVR